MNFRSIQMKQEIIVLLILYIMFWVFNDSFKKKTKQKKV